MTDVLKRYIDASNAFRKAADYHEGAIALYDLLYDLQAKEERTKEEERILTDTYSLLGYHLSAYETFLRIADPTNYKEKSKLVVLEDKAKSHKDTFCIKDIRKLRGKREQKPNTKLCIFKGGYCKLLKLLILVSTPLIPINTKSTSIDYQVIDILMRLP